MRIHITGNAGAGKTTLANLVADQYRLPVFHLDQLVWMAHWKKAPVDKRKKYEREWISKKSWVIEGVSREVRNSADIIIFLDVPRFKCAWRSIKRGFRFLHRTRPEMPEHCPEIVIIPRVLKIIWNFPRVVRKQLLSESHESSKFVVVTYPQQGLEALEEFNCKSVT